MQNKIKHNFGAGPCILPQTVMNQAAKAVINWDDTGLSILEVSHRSKEFENVVKNTEALIRELLNVPETHAVLFLQGGASTQFSMLALNFLKERGKAAYIDTGYFAQKAITEARLFGDVHVIGSSADQKYSYIPEIKLPDFDPAYVHFTSNNTIEGTQFSVSPKTSFPIFCDMSSDIFSREIHVAAFDLIYAGAQKNLGPAGMTLVIARNSLLDSVSHKLPAMSDYRLIRDNNSMYNTPPVFSIYVAMLNLKWLKEQGGVAEIERRNKKKAELLYAEIDANPLFYGTASVTDRSIMNVTFKTYDSEHEVKFLKYAQERAIVGIKGYRTAGGFRASLYNALPLESVIFLVEVMREFTAEVSAESEKIQIDISN